MWVLIKGLNWSMSNKFKLRFIDFDRVPDDRLPNVYCSVCRVLGRQRSGMLCGLVLNSNAIGYQHVHREYGSR